MVIPEFLKEEYPFDSKYLTIGGHRMHYVDEGEGEPIVMVHGNPTWSFYYRNLIKDFRRTNRVVVPDHIGCGLSDKPQESEDFQYILQNHINNLVFLIQKLELKNITLIVHDWGGAIGFGYATLFPENIKRVVILNTAAFIDNNIPLRISLCKIPYIGEWLVRKWNAFAAPATFMAVTKKLSSDIKKGYLLPYDNYKNRVAISRFVEDIPLNANHISYKILHSIEMTLNRLKVPTLILWGKKDFCFTEHFFWRWKEIYPHAITHIYEDGGHYILEDAHGDIEDRIRAFITKLVVEDLK